MPPTPQRKADRLAALTRKTVGRIVHGWAGNHHALGRATLCRDCRLHSPPERLNRLSAFRWLAVDVSLYRSPGDIQRSCDLRVNEPLLPQKAPGGLRPPHGAGPRLHSSPVERATTLLEQSLDLNQRPLRPEGRGLMSRNHGKHLPSKGYVECNLCLLCLQWPVSPVKRAFTVHSRGPNDFVAQNIYHRLILTEQFP
jgi:hypothetical protein